jgi:hypothetical protein
MLLLGVAVQFGRGGPYPVGALVGEVGWVLMALGLHKARTACDDPVFRFRAARASVTTWTVAALSAALVFSTHPPFPLVLLTGLVAFLQVLFVSLALARLARVLDWVLLRRVWQVVGVTQAGVVALLALMLLRAREGQGLGTLGLAVVLAALAAELYYVASLVRTWLALN